MSCAKTREPAGIRSVHYSVYSVVFTVKNSAVLRPIDAICRDKTLRALAYEHVTKLISYKFLENPMRSRLGPIVGKAALVCRICHACSE